ncbi:MAG: CRISPR-associated helicase/endonuclease Cas3 [Gemmatales bacterium]|nr:MAG: CRISPR-associated helicase/endonuclease Cas3 [Gemmatales bacterium]
MLTSRLLQLRCFDAESPSCVFPVLGSSLPTDHGYALYAAVSQLLPAIHESGSGIAIGPISGQHLANGLLQIDRRRSYLRLRLPTESIGVVLSLAGKCLDVGGHAIRLGVPRVRALIPAPAVIARMVTIKGFTEPTDFLAAVNRQLKELGIESEPEIPLVVDGPHAGKPRRRIMKIKDRRVVGFAVQINGLSVEESIRVQEAGIGGQTEDGLWFFCANNQGAVTMDSNRLWAKSKRDDEDEISSMLLPGHLEDVYNAALCVLEATASDQLAALGLGLEHRARLECCVKLAAAVHDLGKANDHFQGMILRTPGREEKTQGIRHEWVTVLMLKHLREWLLKAVGNSDVDFAIVEWAVAGHHPSPNHPSPPKNLPDGAGVQIKFLMGHRDYATALEWLSQIFGLSAPPRVTNVNRHLVGTDNLFTEIVAWARSAQRIWDGMNTSDRRLVAAVKNCLVAADIAGSALPKQAPDDPDRWRWIVKSFAEKPRTGEIQSIVDERSKGFAERNEDRERFQSAVEHSAGPVTYVKAGCGTGKTLAAYRWAAANHPTRRLYFCYPTTGTATEGFKDYLFVPDVKADLFHSRRQVDFEIILDTGPDAKDADSDTAIRVDTLDSWSTPIVACTVDTVLGIVQNNKRGLYAWPALAQAAFVFDEIHAYDDRLFGALLRFLRDLPGVPVLLMTASLPRSREKALQDLLKQQRGIDLVAIAGPDSLENLPRYRKLVVKDNDPMGIVRNVLKNDGKVLWVCNTVKRVMEAADIANDCNPRIYHSRFKYVDRVERHKDVIKSFDRIKNAGPALAICSQVAEMSLDLSADLLVTDLAPVPALIQRLGRLNRRAREGDATKPFIVVDPDDHLPYTPADLEAARTWYQRLADDNISQRQLAAAWEQTGDHPPELVASAWLDGGPTTTVTELRETSPGISVLMEEDLSRVRANRKELAKFVLPMPAPPKKLSWRTWPRERGLPVAPVGTIDYCAERGATWRE